MSLVTARKRGNRWEYRFEGLSVSGKRKQFSKSGFQTKKEALDAGNKAYNEYRNTGKRFGVNEISVSDYLDRWFELYVKAELKYNTQQAYKQIVENHLKPTFGDYALSALEPTPIVEFMNTLKYQNYSQSMLTGILTLFSSALDYAVEPLHYIPWNPAKLVKIPKSNKPKEELIILQPEELKRILERMKGTRFFVPICLGYFCGLRVSEACGLTWDCVDLEKNEITIEKQLVERGHGAGEIRPLVNVKRADERVTVSGLNLDAELANKTVDGTLHLPVAMTDSALQVRAQTEHQFSVSDFMKPEKMSVDYHTQVHQLRAHVAGEDIRADLLHLDFATDSTTALNLTTDGLNLSANSPMHVLQLVDKLQPLLNAVGDSTIIQPLTSLQDLTMLDTLRRLIPALDIALQLTHGSPAQPFIDRMGLDINRLNMALASDAQQTGLALSASMPELPNDQRQTTNDNSLRLPPAQANLDIAMTEGQTDASLTAESHLTDGASSFHGLQTDAALRLNLQRKGRELHGDGRLTLDSVVYDSTALGSHAIDMQIAPSKLYANALRADVHTEAIPLELVNSFVSLTDIALHGAVRASASVDGLPDQTDISAEVQPLGIRAEYTPYQVALGLGETPITMIHNHVDLNGLPIYGADSTYLALTGGLDLNSMQVDVTLEADSFAPTKLPQGGPIPVYGELATDIRGRVTGPLDSIIADVDVTILPTTDITYPIDKKNLAQVKPSGKVNVKDRLAEEDPLSLGGRINVDDGFIRYSPKLYPVMPFHVDSGSHVTFNGPLGQTRLNVSASQQV